MKISQLTNALREEPLPRLAREAAWRTMRSTRKAAFHVTASGRNSKYPIQFRPIGYYQLQKDAVSAESRTGVIAYANAIVAGRFPLPGYGSPSLGLRPDWQCDWVSGKSWPLVRSRKLPIVRHDGSDVKAPWELSRLQWSPVVAKAWALTGDLRYRRVLESLLTDWMVNNPPGKGVNWTVAMEASLRGISLCLTMELLWPFNEAEQPWLRLLEKSLWQHLRFIEIHSEFSWLLRSNHYLSNLIGLTTLSAYLQGRGIEQRRERYARAVQREVLLQTYADGGDREASTGYHLLVAQMGLHSLRVQKKTACVLAPEFEARVRLMFEWMGSVADDTGILPPLGDCDNGRVELLADDIAQAGLDAGLRHGLKAGGLAGLASHLLQLPLGGHAQDAVWFGGQASTPSHQRNPLTMLPESGIAVLRAGDASVIFCAMPNGLNGKGSHTHCDKLSFVLRLRGEARGELAAPRHDEVFCDSGSRCYTRSAELRNRDRSTRAHNTLSIDEAEQNSIALSPRHLFQCGNEATVSAITQRKCEPLTVQASHQGYARFGIDHERTVQLHDLSLLIIDEVSGADPSQSHLLELNFVLGPEWIVSPERVAGDRVSCRVAGPRQLTFACESAGCLVMAIAPTEIAREYGAALPATSIRIHTSARLPVTLRTTVNWS